MGKTWTRRRDELGRRVAQPLFQKAYLRLCCETNPREAHLPTCHRHPLMCGDKTGFEERRNADQAAERIASKTGGPRRVYRCPDCDLWHLTTLAES